MRSPSTRVWTPKEHGRYIYAYCHVRTNQVVYSLTRTLRATGAKAALKQLPDLGANNTDKQLRKDLWRPLYTVCLPQNGERQGLAAFRKLREYRKLHELNWTPSPSLTKPFTEAEVEEMKNRLGNKGGSKKENVYDIIKRVKRHMRVREVQDQKANSIADLAAVLSEQAQLGAKTGPPRDEVRKQDRVEEVNEMLELNREADLGGVMKLESEIAQMQSKIDGLSDGQRDEDGLSKSALKAMLYKRHARKLRMEYAVNAVHGVYEARAARAAEVEARKVAVTEAEAAIREAAAVRPEQAKAAAQRVAAAEAAAMEAEARAEAALPSNDSPEESSIIKEAREARERAARILKNAERSERRVKSQAQALELKASRAKHDLREAEQKARDADVAEAAESASVEDQSPVPSAASPEAKPQELNWALLLPSFPPRDPSRVPRGSPEWEKLRLLNKPVFSAEGVTIKWANTLDPELAETWPSGLTHEPMGWTRYTAPLATDKDAAKRDISGFKASLWPNRTPNWLPESEEKEEKEESEKSRARRERKEEQSKKRNAYVSRIKDDIVGKLQPEKQGWRQQAARLDVPMELPARPQARA
ncbi:hypothetical protein B0A50_03788 [Salinomyces thailandicus]|uniref:Large ribosomal subunit protein mL67 n=1 Tax=Salinomyces thailandicus TaxID=706561 RepID=A0A4U0U2Z6_9PEZI|nr:hypothetical protein B0A50_03788 [Salinomyces thailandica]